MPAEKLTQHPRLPLRLCTDRGCEYFGRHYENCEACFGFGVKRDREVDGRPVPVNAPQASGRASILGGGPLTDDEIAVCPICGSNRNGAPAEAIENCPCGEHHTLDECGSCSVMLYECEIGDHECDPGEIGEG